MKAVIDRFESEFAVLTPLDGGSVINVPRKILPAGARPGDTVQRHAYGWALDIEDTEARKQRIGKKMKQLFPDE